MEILHDLAYASHTNMAESNSLMESPPPLDFIHLDTHAY